MQEPGGEYEQVNVSPHQALLAPTQEAQVV